MTDFVRVPDPNLDTGKPTRSTDIKRIRDNQDDHEARILAIEDSGIRVASTFNQRHFYESGGNFDDVVVTGGNYVQDYEGFFLHSQGQIINQIGISSAADDHYLEWNNPGQIIGNLAFNFANRTKPITFSTRMWFADALNNAFYIGLTVAPAYNANSVPTDGIWLQQKAADHTQWQFTATSSVGGGTETPVDVARIANSTWFDVDIVFTDDPGNRALCYLDGSLIATFTTANALSTTINLHGRATWTWGAGDTIRVDRMSAQCSGVVTDVP